MAKTREPKTIDEVRTLLKAAVPDGTRLHLSAYYYDHPDAGTSYSRVDYSCSMDHEKLRIKIEVRAHKPADLAKKAIKALAEAQQPRDLVVVAKPSPARSRRTPRTPSVPKLTQQQPLLGYGN